MMRLPPGDVLAGAGPRRRCVSAGNDGTSGNPQGRDPLPA
jgi:hypothetical protein